MKLRYRYGTAHRLIRHTSLTLERLEDRDVPMAGALDPTFGSGGPAAYRHPPVCPRRGHRSPGRQHRRRRRSTRATTSEDFAVCRLLPDGSLDTSFNGTGMQIIDFGSSQEKCYAMAVAGDKIIVAGFVGLSEFDFAVARLNGDGTLDFFIQRYRKADPRLRRQRRAIVSAWRSTRDKIVLAGQVASATSAFADSPAQR